MSKQVNVTFKASVYPCSPKQPLLDSLLAQDVPIPFSCRNGFCHSCMAKLTKGEVPKAAQEGLNDSLKSQGCFLPCICHPNQDLEIELATADNIDMGKEDGVSNFSTYTTMVIDKTWLNDDVLRLCLVKPEGLSYKAGQFINIIQPETQLSRSYSLASLPSENFIEFHIKRVPDGVLSNWICDELALGTNIDISGPMGECYYQQGEPNQTLILAGVGTGLAPLYGIAHDALESNHQSDIYLFHASVVSQGLYYQDEIKTMAATSPNLKYFPCVLKGETPENGLQGSLDQLIVQQVGDCQNMKAYLCGDGTIVDNIGKSLFMAGLAKKDILADAFTAKA
ncbi:MAG: 2Fe-2S iron-sulfur cluster binding domain-containing protein [Ghiorsea sp.]